MITKLIGAILNIFDGEGGAAPQGETVNSDSTQSQDLKQVKYGKQPEPAKEETKEKPESTKKTFKELINGEYKDDYTKATQEIINKRFKETKEIQAKLDSLAPLHEALSLKYGVEDGNVEAILKAIESDSDFLAEQAEKRGMTTEQYKQFANLESQNKQLKAAQDEASKRAEADEQVKIWMKQAEAVKAKYPNFNLDEEIKNKDFFDMISSRHVDIEHAYKVVHFDELMNDAVAQTKQSTEKAVTQNIRAKGNRPQENGTQIGSAFTIKSDVSKLTKADRAEVAKRAQRGERIVF